VQEAIPPLAGKAPFRLAGRLDAPPLRLLGVLALSLLHVNTSVRFAQPLFSCAGTLRHAVELPPPPVLLDNLTPPQPQMQLLYY
jgi:hypothetical protein